MAVATRVTRIPACSAMFFDDAKEAGRNACIK
jgi:hypothetical protein